MREYRYGESMNYFYFLSINNCSKYIIFYKMQFPIYISYGLDILLLGIYLFLE